MRRLETYAFPYLGHRPVAEITALEILTCVRRIEALNKLETAHRTLQAIGQVIRYAMLTVWQKAIQPLPYAVHCRRPLPAIWPRLLIQRR